mmetsp:Transcript_33723/g.88692  ORF Transcript_33723/g.88692 Transcript_33723/m.88692 type:complete len:111 (-) Transcript_33723:65-397(-)
MPAPASSTAPLHSRLHTSTVELPRPAAGMCREEPESHAPPSPGSSELAAPFPQSQERSEAPALRDASSEHSSYRQPPPATSRQPSLLALDPRPALGRSPLGWPSTKGSIN